MKSRTREAFTLVELLVVITIIGMLVGMLLPAVQAARERGRQARCMNNQKQISLGLLQFEGTRRMFPGYVNYLGIAPTSSEAFDGSWVVPILPMLERNDLWNLWKESSTALRADRVGKLEILICPSDTESTGDSPLSYGVNCGLPDGDTSTTDTAATALFHNHNYNRRTNKVTVSIDYLTQHDGSTNTLMLTDSVRPNPYPKPSSSNPLVALTWAVGQKDSTDATIFHNLSTLSTSSVDNLAFFEVTTGINWSGTAAYQYRINQACDKTALGYSYAFPTSTHPQIVIGTFCDGHQMSLREDMDYDVLQHLMTPYGRGAGLLTTFDAGRL